MVSFYYNLMIGRMFTKSNQQHASTKYAIGGLGYRSEQLLREVNDMEVGDTIQTNGYTLTRVE